MKKKIFVTLVVAVGVAFAGYNVMKSENNGKKLSDLVSANIEALAGGEIGTGVYKRSTSKCPPPVEYKTSVSCSRGGTEDCSPSDC